MMLLTKIFLNDHGSEIGDGMIAVDEYAINFLEPRQGGGTAIYMDGEHMRYVREEMVDICHRIESYKQNALN